MCYLPPFPLETVEECPTELPGLWWPVSPRAKPEDQPKPGPPGPPTFDRDKRIKWIQKICRTGKNGKLSGLVLEIDPWNFLRMVRDQCPEGFQQWWNADNYGVGPCILDNRYPWHKNFLDGKWRFPDTSPCTCGRQLSPNLHADSRDTSKKTDLLLSSNMREEKIATLRAFQWQNVLLHDEMVVTVPSGTDVKIPPGGYIQFLQDTDVVYSNPSLVNRNGHRRVEKAGKKIKVPMRGRHDWEPGPLRMSLEGWGPSLLPPVFRAGPDTKILGVRSGFEFRRARSSSIAILPRWPELPHDHDNDPPQWGGISIDKFPPPKNPNDFNQIRDAVRKFDASCRKLRQEGDLRDLVHKQEVQDAKDRIQELEEQRDKAERENDSEGVRAAKEELDKEQDRLKKEEEKRAEKKKEAERKEQRRKGEAEKILRQTRLNDKFRDQLQECWTWNYHLWRRNKYIVELWSVLHPIVDPHEALELCHSRYTLEKIQLCRQGTAFVDGTIRYTWPPNPYLPEHVNERLSRKLRPYEEYPDDKISPQTEEERKRAEEEKEKARKERDKIEKEEREKKRKHEALCRQQRGGGGLALPCPPGEQLPPWDYEDFVAACLAPARPCGKKEEPKQGRCTLAIPGGIANGKPPGRVYG